MKTSGKTGFIADGVKFITGGVGNNGVTNSVEKPVTCIRPEKGTDGITLRAQPK